jgi:drug/metabolite transporter (DMT)-like permease
MRFLAFGAMAVVWGLTWIAAKWALDVAPPVFVAGLRLAGACAGFLLWCLIARLSLAVPRMGRLLSASLLLNTGCYSFLFWGVAHTPTGIAAIVNLSLVPVLSMLVGALYGEETISVRRLAAVALGAVGLTLLFTAREQTGGPDESRIGLGLAAIVVATLSYAWGAILSKPLVRAMPPAVVAFWQTLIGAVSLLALSVIVEGFDPGWILALSHGRPFAGMAFLIVGGSLVGFSVYLWLLREWGAFRAGLYAFVSPAIAVWAGVGFAGESFGPWEAFGMVLMLAATGLVVRPEKERVTAS